MTLSAATLATAVTLAVTTPTVAASHPDAPVASPVTTSYQLLVSESEDHGPQRELAYGDWGGLFAGFGGILGGLRQMGADYLNANQAAVLAFAANIPILMIGPVAIGGGHLANAYYFGDNGSPTGGAGVLAYVFNQIANGLSLQNLVKTVVMGVTGVIPKFYLGPVQIGGGLLAGAWFNGYGGDYGLAGVSNYIKSQLGVPAAAAAKAAAADPPSVAVTAREAAKPTAGHSARAAQAVPSPRSARAAAASASSTHPAAAASAPAKTAATTHGGSKRPAA